MHKNWMQHQSEDRKSLTELWHISEDYKSDYTPNVEKGLLKLKKRIANEQSETSTKVIPMRRFTFVRVAATVLFLVVAGFLFRLSTASDDIALQQLVTKDQLMDNISLPDGSKVWLNKHSQLVFPEKFDGTERVVELNGEAYFEVTKNTNQPFIVKMSQSTVKVLGTAFNIRAYPNETTTTVDVTEGKVAFASNKSTATATLQAADKVVLNRADATLSVVTTLDWKDVAWKEKQLNFQDQPLSEVLAYLNTNFEVKVDYDEAAIKNCPLNATILDNSAKSILNQITLAFDSIELTQIDSNLYELSGTCD